jgi:hypothetical protein
MGRAVTQAADKKKEEKTSPMTTHGRAQPKTNRISGMMKRVALVVLLVELSTAGAISAAMIASLTGDTVIRYA